MAYRSTLQLIRVAGQHATQQSINHSSAPLSSRGWTALAHVCRVCTEDLLAGSCSRTVRQEPTPSQQCFSSSHRDPQLETAVPFNLLQHSVQHAFQLQRCSAHVPYRRGNLSAAVPHVLTNHPCAAPRCLDGTLCYKGFSTKSSARNGGRESSRAAVAPSSVQHVDGSGDGAQQHLAKSIASLETLRDAEELLVAQRSQFRVDALLSDAGGVVPLLQELCAQAGAKLAQCSGADLCNLAWALVRLQGLYGGALKLAPPTLSPEWQQQHRHLRQLSHGNTPAHAEHSQAPEPAPLVVEDSTLPKTWAALSNVLLGGRKLKQATGDDVAKLSWAMAKAKHEDLPLLDAMAQRVTSVCSAVLPLEEQDPSASGVQLMSRLARLSLGQRRMALKALQQRKREIRVKEAMALRAARKAALQANQMERSNKGALLLGRSEDRQHLLLTGSKQAEGPAAATAAATRREAKHVGSLIPSPSGIANLAWAFLTLGQRAPSMQAALARAAVVQKADFTPSSLATVLWAYAACGYYDRVMCNTLGRRAALSLKHMSMQEVTQVCWSLATLRHHEPLLTLRLAHLLADRAVTLLWALAQMPLSAPPAAARVEGSGLGPAASFAHTQAASQLCRVLLIPGVIKCLSMRDCVRALWGAAVLGILPGEQEDRLSMRDSCHNLAARLLLRLHSCSPQELSQEHLGMLHQASQVVGGWRQVQRNLAVSEVLQPQGDVSRRFEQGGPHHLEPDLALQDSDWGADPDNGVPAAHSHQHHHYLHEQQQHHHHHQQQQQQREHQQQEQQCTAQDPAFGLKEDASGIIDVSHMPLPAFLHSKPLRSGPHAQLSVSGDAGAEQQEVQCLPRPLREAAQAAALGSAAALVQGSGKSDLWAHEASRVAEALGLEPML
ncbi:hypothetical protein DUNSADRAFT_6360 [Dunaliella salina]|uniref:Uncharacterized protein n=1 Tax=Dunaliella salina TaxID=3046 RepID=A0ABQ7GNG8_DUNSA|nr:hypothetical protein DUNSADRAFT_6360 [Dunaliella salina]|eukprot:KAF5836157.1 hypothetical protein DUNSADRAFT_6360 [Dunaliella salina]